MPENTLNPSNPGIGSILNMKRNMLICLVKRSATLAFLLMLLSVLLMYSSMPHAVSHIIRLTAGPAKAISE